MLQRILLTGLISGAVAGVLLTLVHLVMVQPLIAQAETYENAAPAPVQVPAAHTHQGGLAHSHGGGGIIHTHEAAGSAHAHAAGLSHSHAGGAMAHTHESVTAPVHSHANGLTHAHDGGQAAHSYEARTHSHDQAAWEPEEGAERTLFTLLSNILVSIAYGLILAAAWVMFGRPERISHGLLWGAAGFACFAFMPALGLPPELPGAAAGDLVARQTWWLGTAFGTAIGLGLCVFSAKWSMRVAGAAVILLPHVIGAPHAELGQAGSAPPELAAYFVMVSLFASAVLWSALGVVGAYVAARLEVTEDAPLVAPKPSA
ncbi:MAG: CbtA family protein [Rhodospirillales bacterium]|nr:CbtA family protein [Rhodospirillales bacterium]